MRQLPRQDDGLVANAPKRSDRVRDQDCGSTIDEEPEGNPRGSNAEFQLGPEQPDRHQEYALKRAQRMHRQPNSRRGEPEDRAATQQRIEDKDDTDPQPTL